MNITVVAVIVFGIFSIVVGVFLGLLLAKKLSKKLMIFLGIGIALSIILCITVVIVHKKLDELTVSDENIIKIEKIDNFENNMLRITNKNDFNYVNVDTVQGLEEYTAYLITYKTSIGCFTKKSYVLKFEKVVDYSSK